MQGFKVEIFAVDCFGLLLFSATLANKKQSGGKHDILFKCKMPTNFYYTAASSVEQQPLLKSVPSLPPRDFLRKSIKLDSKRLNQNQDSESLNYYIRKRMKKI